MNEDKIDQLFRSRAEGWAPAPKAGAWERLQARRQGEKRNKAVWWWGVAAAVLLMGLSIGLFRPWEPNFSNTPIAVADTVGTSAADTSVAISEPAPDLAHAPTANGDEASARPADQLGHQGQPQRRAAKNPRQTAHEKQRAMPVRQEKTMAQKQRLPKATPTFGQSGVAALAKGSASPGLAATDTLPHASDGTQTAIAMQSPSQGPKAAPKKGRVITITLANPEEANEQPTGGRPGGDGPNYAQKTGEGQKTQQQNIILLARQKSKNFTLSSLKETKNSLLSFSKRHKGNAN